ncbi:MAG: phage head-tail connector protein [Methylocella sp.]
MASRFDLVSLTALKNWLAITGTDDDVVLARLITQISRAIFNVIDRPAILPSAYTETYDGGNDVSIMLRQWPVTGITSCVVDGVAIPPSPPLVAGTSAQIGYVLDTSDAAPPGAPQRLSLRGFLFTCGVQNVTISYSAGYQITNESAVIPATPPYSVTAQGPYGDWASDGGVAFSNGVFLTAVTGNPAAGQYAVVNGVYSFAQQDAGATVLPTYGYVPADLASCCMDWAAERYAYRSRIGQHSKSLGGQETMAFVVKDIPDFVVSALSPYRRVVMP